MKLPTLSPGLGSTYTDGRVSGVNVLGGLGVHEDEHRKHRGPFLHRRSRRGDH